MEGEYKGSCLLLVGFGDKLMCDFFKYFKSRFRNVGGVWWD